MADSYYKQREYIASIYSISKVILKVKKVGGGGGGGGRKKVGSLHIFSQTMALALLHKMENHSEGNMP